MIFADAVNQSQVSADNIVAEYINAHSSCFTHYNAANKSNRWGKDEPMRGAIAGRYTEERNGDMKIAVLWGRLIEFAAERDIGSRALLKWAEGKGGKLTNVRLAPNAIPQKCLVMPIEKEQTRNSSIDTGANLSNKAENHSQ